MIGLMKHTDTLSLSEQTRPGRPCESWKKRTNFSCPMANYMNRPMMLLLSTVFTRDLLVGLPHGSVLGPI